MADDRYGGYGRREGWRERESSIFSDDDDDRRRRGSSRWSDEYGRERGSRDDDRGFFERAGDEVRSWFGDEDAERRRDMDVMRDDARSAFGGSEYESRYGGIRGGYGSSYASDQRGRSDLSRDERERGGWGSDRERDSAFGGAHMGRSRAEQGLSRQGFGGGRSQWDDNYRQWRDQQIQQFDREYDDFCRERQTQFDQDFDRWRSSRLTEGGSATPSGPRGQGAAGGTSRSLGSESSGSSMSTGSTTETGGTSEPGTTAARNRGGRSRT